MQSLTLDAGWTLARVRPEQDSAEVGGGALDETVGIEEVLPIANMPAQVADVLRADGRIDAPYLPGKAEEYRWIADSDWVYAVSFDCPSWAGPWRLVCAGLDTVADIWLNGRAVGRHENSFLPFSADVSSLLAVGGTNRLQIRFYSITTWLGFTEVPDDVHDLAPARLLRKPFHDFTDYLGAKPFFARVGIFDEVTLVADGAGRLADVSVDASVAATLDAGRVRIECSGVVHGGAATVQVRLTDPAGAGTTTEWPVVESNFTRSFVLDVDEPALWWPRGYGDQHIYEVAVSLVVDGAEQDRRTVRTAFRRVEMPTPLHFTVNGRPVRLWGADWAPLDATTRCWDSERARALLDVAALGHVNALRVWGEGAPLPEEFYELADRHGFMLWQDFHQMPLSMDEESRAAGRGEAAYTIRRLRHHPSILVWCGGNENAMWHDFKHPKTPYPQRVILEDDLRQVCDRLDPSRVYVPDSPYYGLDANDPRVWDTHGYTNIWFVPGYDYLNFATEDTRISAPMLRSCRRFMAAEDLVLDGYSTVRLPDTRYPWPTAWTRYTASEGWRKVGPVEQFYDAIDAEGVIHRLGTAAGAYYRDVVERQRRGRPSGLAGGERRCGGYLAWKLNDSWPEIYSAKIDYFGEPYISFYALKRAFAPVLISFDVGAFIHVWVVNDTVAPVAGELWVRLVHLHTNEVRAEASFPVRVEPDASLDVADLTELLGTFRREHLLMAQLRGGDGRMLATTTSLMDLERNLDLPVPHLTVTQEGEALIIGTDAFARSVYLEGEEDGDEFGWLFDDNYFDLAPGEVKVVPVHGRHRRGTIRVRPYYGGRPVTVDYAVTTRVERES